MKEVYNFIFFQYAKDKQALMRCRRHRQNKRREEPILFKKPEEKVVPQKNSETRKQTKKTHSGNWGYTVKVAKVIAWYVNPAFYIIFSVVYFAIGMAI